MTHQDAGHYAAKHPEGTVPDPEITEAVKAKSKGQGISCAAAHHIAADLNVAPAEVGKVIDLLDYRIVKCQLGLFGYTSEKKRVRAAEKVEDDLARAVRAATTMDGRLPCETCWSLAERFTRSKIAVAGACENLGIKIKPCQLGAF